MMNSDRRDKRMERAKEEHDRLERQRIHNAICIIEEAVEEMYDRLADIELTLDELGNPAEGIAARAKAYWLAHIDGALMNRRGWLGGSFVSYENTLEELRGLVEEREEE